jgi:hypothetical protein
LFLIAKVFLRSKSGFWFRSLFCPAERTEIAESFLASLEIWAFVWVACLGLDCLALVITEMNGNDRSITEIFFLLGGLLGLGGRLLGLEKHYRNISCFARNLGVCIGCLSGAGLSRAGYYRNGQK